MTAIAILTLAQVYLELRICSRIKFLHRWNRKSPLFGGALSVVLSILCSAAFGAAGMIVLVSGLASTVITQMYYSLPDNLYIQLGKRGAELSAWIGRSKDQWYANAMLALRAVVFIWSIAILPLRGLFAVLRFIDRRTA